MNNTLKGSRIRGKNMVVLTWDASLSPDVVGYKVHYGRATGVYDTSVEVGNHLTTEINNLEDGEWFFAVTAFDSKFNESGFSNEVSTVIDTTVPEPPTNVKVIQVDVNVTVNVPT